MPVAGPNSPSTVISDNATGTRPWVNPSNAKASDDVYAEAGILSAGQVTHYLRSSGYGFALSGAANILGIELTIERKGDPNDRAEDWIVHLIKGGVAGGINKASTSSWSQTETTITYGGPTDTWGLSWSATDINDPDFGAALSITANGGFPVIASVDHVTITVHYGGDQSIFPEGIPSSEAFGNAQVELGGIESFQRQVGSGGDDWYDGGAVVGFDNTSVEIPLGRGLTSGGLRFTNLTIPAGATIQANTTLTFTAAQNRPANCPVRLRAVAAANPAAPTTDGQHDALTPTTAFVDWTLPELVAGTEYTSPPVNALLQEVIALPGWAPGNALIIYLEIITGSFFAEAVAYDGTPADAAKLDVEYAVPPTGLNIRPEGIPSSEAFGTPDVQPDNVDLTPTGIPSDEAFGTPSLDMNLQLTPTGIASGEAFGTIALDLNLDLTPTGIPSSEAFGTMTLDITGPQTIEPLGIPSSEAFGTISVEVEGFVPPPEPVTADLYTPPTYVIWLREPDTLDAVQRLARMETLSFTRRDYQLGAFSFSVHNDYISQDWLLGDGLIEVLRNGEQVYLGMVDSVTLDEATGIWRVSGVDARGWFSFRDAWPASGEEYDSVSAVTAGNAIIHYVENNFSAPTDIDRDVDGELGTNVGGQAVSWTVPATSALGATTSYDARYINLLTLLFQLARGGDILFWVKLAISTGGLTLYNRYELQITEGTDRTEGEIGGMVFSVGIGTASRITYTLNRRGHRNTLLTLGQGDGVDRVAVEVEDAADVAAHFRREATLDARNAATNGTLALTANPSAAETVAIEAATYTFVTSLANANDVLIGANVKSSLANLAAAINGDVGEGSVYGTGTTLNADVVATTGDAGLTVQLKGLRTAGVALSETLANGSWSAASIALDALEEAGEAKVAESIASAESWTVVPDPIRAPWRDSWDLGDVVTVRSQYLTAASDKVITAVSVKYSRASGEQISINLGDPPPTIGEKLAGKLGEINRVIVE